MAWRMRPGFIDQANRGTGVSPCLLMQNSVESQRQQLLAMLNPCDVAGMQNLGMTATSRLAKRPFLYGMLEADDEFGDCESVRRGGRVEKKRRLTPEQVRSLETSFESENKLEPDRKLKLAQQLGLQPRQVAVWFQNRRARWKTKELERLYESLKLRFDAELAEKERWKAEATKLAALLREREGGEREGEEESRKKMIVSSVCEDNIISQKPERNPKFAEEKTAANDTTPHPLLQLENDVADHNNEDDDDGSGAGDYSWLLKASHTCTNTNNNNCSFSSCGCRAKVEVECNNANSNTNQFQPQPADQYHQQQQHNLNSALDPEQMYYSYMFRSGFDETFNSLLWCWPDFSRTIISSTSGGAPATTATPATTVVTNNSSSSSNPLADVL